MDFSTTPVENVPIVHNTYTPEINPVYNTDPVDSINPVFAPDTVSLGNVESPYETYSPPPIAPVTTPEVTGDFDVGSYYPISEEEVIPKLRELRQIIGGTDLTAKTELETYNLIENQFIDAFGKDFLIARELNLPSSMFYIIGVEYANTLSKYIDDPAQVNRTRLYGDAGTEEIQNTIRAKYPETLTNRDLFKMVHEMRDAGVLEIATHTFVGADGTVRQIDMLSLLRSYTRHSTQDSDELLSSLSFEERDIRWINIFDSPVNKQFLMLLYNLFASNSRAAVSNSVSSFITNFLGGVQGDDGLFILNPNQGSGHVNDNELDFGHEEYFGHEEHVGHGEHVDHEEHVGHEPEHGNEQTDGSGEAHDYSALIDMILREKAEYDDLISSRLRMIDEAAPVIEDAEEGSEELVVEEAAAEQ